MKIWVDADACPKIVKEIVYKASFRLKISVILVANSYLSTPQAPNIKFVQVDQGADVADDYIADNCSLEDLVITADIPLASKIVNKNAVAINPRGEIYTEENISERLSVRDFMQDLRDSGINTTGPAPLGPKDKERFTNALDRLLTKMLKNTN